MTETEPIEKKVIKRQGELEKVRRPFEDLAKESTALGYPAREQRDGDFRRHLC
jgi:hypothetical protein